MRLPPGARLGSCEIVDALGAGGMGEVYRARDLKLGRDVAIKILPGLVDAEAHTRFEREARAVAALNHPHIVTIHDISRADGIDFIVMELVAGRSLDRLIPTGGLSIETAVDYGAQIAGALAAAHRAGIVHRDIKPANIMVTDDGLVKVLDFGLAKIAHDSDPAASTATDKVLTVAGSVMGTVAYMSPEQAQGHVVDARSDVFSFGAVLYEMLTWRRAFAGDTQMATLAVILAGAPAPLPTLRSGVPADLVELVDACLRKERSARPDAAAIAARLASLSGSHDRRRRPAWMWTAAAVALAGVLAAGGWVIKRGADARARTTAISEVHRLVDDHHYLEAFVRIHALNGGAADDPEVSTLLAKFTTSLSILSEPAGAEVSIAPYDGTTWIAIGQTPSKVVVPISVLQVKLTKPGFEEANDVLSVTPTSTPLLYQLTPQHAAPPGMVRVLGPKQPVPFYLIPGADPVDVAFADFWIDRYEVTNREFQAFVKAGGYERPELWVEPFVRNGRTVPWEQARTWFRDATGRPGPATWQVGTYSEGQDEWPVTGVSWYEAQAYLKFAGKQLPTLAHWRWVAGYGAVTQILPAANFSGRGPVRVGSTHSINRFGTSDFAGNVKEWVANSGGDDLRYILGGAWDEPAWMFNEADARSPWERSANFGFRGARYDAGDASPKTLGNVIARPNRDYSHESPVAPAIFDAYRRFFAYDHTPITATVAATSDTPECRIEIVTYPAAYGGETIPAYVYLPKNAAPPFQAVVFMFGSSQFQLRSSTPLTAWPFVGPLVRSGRAVIAPIVKGAYQRWTDEFGASTSKESSVWRDYTVDVAKDMSRSLDYLETRADIAREQIGYIGFSRGAALAPIFLALEPQRFKSAALMLPGLYLARPAAEVDVFNFLPRVTQPVLMLNGRFDGIFPERVQTPFFNLLGTPADGKRRMLYDTGHNLPANEMIKETLDWLDRTLGPVKRQ